MPLIKVDKTVATQIKTKNHYSAFDLCSKNAIRSCRVAEIKQAILNSKKLQEEYFTTHESVRVIYYQTKII